MTDTLLIRDLEDTHTKGYLMLSQHLGQIRMLCLAGKPPKILSVADILVTMRSIAALLNNIEEVASRFAQVFSGQERREIQDYLQHVRQATTQHLICQPETLSATLKEIYDNSTELKASLGVFRMTIEMVI